MRRGDIDAARRLLKNSGWLTGTPGAFADELLGRCTLVSVKRGDCVYRLGDPPDGLRGVVDGGFAFEIAPFERGPVLAHIFHPGSWFGEMELFSGTPKIASITATRPSLLLHVRQSKFDDLMNNDPQGWRWIGLLASQHLALALGVIDDASLRRPAQRIAALLLRLADVRMTDRPHDAQPEIDITQDDLAHLATVSRATVVAQLTALEDAGLIRRSYGKVQIIDPAQIRASVLGEPSQ